VDVCPLQHSCSSRCARRQHATVKLAPTSATCSRLRSRWRARLRHRDHPQQEHEPGWNRAQHRAPVRCRATRIRAVRCSHIASCSARCGASGAASRSIFSNRQSAGCGRSSRTIVAPLPDPESTRCRLSSAYTRAAEGLHSRPKRSGCLDASRADSLLFQPVILREARPKDPRLRREADGVADPSLRSG
jgi:hypothetical protein